MTTTRKKIQNIYDSIDGKVATLDMQIDQINQHIQKIEDEIDIMESYIMVNTSNNLKKYLEKVVEQKYDSKYNIVYGSKFNNLDDVNNANLTDWKIVDPENEIVYQHSGIGWDNDSTINNYILVWDFIKDYLIHAIDSLGNYGLYANLSMMSNACTTLINTKLKITNSKAIFGEYLK